MSNGQDRRAEGGPFTTPPPPAGLLGCSLCSPGGRRAGPFPVGHSQAAALNRDVLPAVPESWGSLEKTIEKSSNLGSHSLVSLPRDQVPAGHCPSACPVPQQADRSCPLTSSSLARWAGQWVTAARGKASGVHPGPGVRAQCCFAGSHSPCHSGPSHYGAALWGWECHSLPYALRPEAGGPWATVQALLVFLTPDPPW